MKRGEINNMHEVQYIRERILQIKIKLNAEKYYIEVRYAPNENTKIEKKSTRSYSKK